MRNSGTTKDNRYVRLRFSVVPSSCSTAVGGMQIAAIMDESKKMAKKMTSVIRILAMSLYLRKYLRSVMRAARWDDEERAQM
jgi:hypothetical protein